ncbi:ImmA/IrrE family metallo-endopeptidase [Sphingomonas sp. CJ99]
MDLADCGSPERLLAVILQHHPEWRPPVDIETFARTVGIIDFVDLEADGFVGALQTDMEKTKGIILAAAGLSRARRRFTVSHELGHYLIPAHRGDKRCTTRDLLESRRETSHQKEEAQANRFAAGLLMPKPWFVDQVHSFGSPDIDHLRILSATYDVSQEAAGSRYAELTGEACAFVFLKDGRIRYSRTSRYFPDLAIRSGDQAPSECRDADNARAWQDVRASDWLKPTLARQSDLRMQILNQANGFQTALLFMDSVEESEAEEDDDLVRRYTPRF